jgi:hypothetical protein
MRSVRDSLGKAVDRTRVAGRRVLERWRHAKHPWRGWRRWAVIAGEATAGLILLFAVVNLTLSLTTFRGDDPSDRMRHELVGLWHSAPDGQPLSRSGFVSLYGQALGTEPSADHIRAYVSDQAADDEFLLDHLLIDHIVQRFGRVDARTLPVGVYVGAHALGPDGLPFVPVTKYLAHYLLFPRHAYILVVPPQGPAMTFSASQAGKFDPGADHPDQLRAEIAPFDARAYDFPSSGQALHEMTLITRDPRATLWAMERLTAARDRLAQSGTRYGLLAPNSNTVIGCILEESGVVTREQRSAVILALRAPGYGADCD